MSEYGFNTLSVSCGAQPDPATGAVATPIYQTTAYVFEGRRPRCGAVQPPGLRQHLFAHHEPDELSTRRSAFAALEGGRAGLAVASGHAAQLIAFHPLMNPGDEFVAAKQALWRLDHAVQALLRQVRLACEIRRWPEA